MVKIKKRVKKSFLEKTAEKTDSVNPLKILELDNHPIITQRRSLSQKSADLLTKIMGSWFFILAFLIFLALWMVANVSWLIFGSTWDPYPFILLNLVLSCLAAIQAPIILMSQNRESQKDRTRAEYDYAVNRKSMREIEEIKKQLNRIEKKV
jgi:uncharacterized membrane protein